MGAMRISKIEPDNHPMRMEIRVIGATDAKRYLEKNDCNRNRTDNDIDLWCRTILDGDFRTNHQGIAFSPDGLLQDGQGRLKGLIKADEIRPGVTITVAHFYNVDPGGIDYGTLRRPYQGANMAGGVGLTKNHEACAKVMIVGMHRNPNEGNPTKMQLQKFILEHQEAISFACAAHGNERCLYNAVRAAVARAWYNTDDTDRLSQFLDRMKDSMPVDNRDKAAITLRSHIYNNFLVAKKKIGESDRRLLYRRSLTAVQYFLDGRFMKSVCEATYQPFPLPGEK